METIVGVGFSGGGDDEEKANVVGCFGCEEPVSLSGSAYACTECRFFLHKACAQLPLTINLPSIFQHPLKLINSRTTIFKSFICDVCLLEGLTHGLCYADSDEFEFNICINCWVLESARKSEADGIKEEAKVKLKHKGLPTPPEDPSTSAADEDTNYLLHFPMSVPFMDPLKLLHLKQLSLDNNDEVEITHPSHDHPLILTARPQDNNNIPDVDDPIETCHEISIFIFAPVVTAVATHLFTDVKLIASSTFVHALCNEVASLTGTAKDMKSH
ncbi:C1-like protein [Tanacetum coccineum]